MDDQLTLRYDALSRTHFWLTSKRFVIDRYLRPALAESPKLERILEVGCCGGRFLSRFLGGVPQVYGLDLNGAALRRCHETYPGIHLVQADGRALPFAQGSFDAIILQDVLEHMEQDADVLRELQGLLSNDGLMFVCVPAYMSLYGHHDRLYGHVRRYTRPELRSKLEGAGFRVLRATYFQSPFLAPLYLKRRFGGGDGDDFIVPPKPVNAFFDWLLRLESVPLSLLDLPFGPTLMALARKVPAEGQ